MHCHATDYVLDIAIAHDFKHFRSLAIMPNGTSGVCRFNVLLLILSYDLCSHFFSVSNDIDNLRQSCLGIDIFLRRSFSAEESSIRTRHGLHDFKASILIKGLLKKLIVDGLVLLRLRSDIWVGLSPEMRWLEFRQVVGLNTVIHDLSMQHLTVKNFELCLVHRLVLVGVEGIMGTPGEHSSRRSFPCMSASVVTHVLFVNNIQFPDDLVSRNLIN